jgi:hypothetical protein
MNLRLTTHPQRLLAVFGLTVLLASRVLAGDPEYLAAVADLPLPAGLVEDVDAGLSFDKPEGRIVEALARGAIAKTDVAAFYRAALPGLGWKPLTDGQAGSRWQRGGEVLSVDFAGNGAGNSGSPLVVRFSIAPN